jgi:hypothetical protein
MAASNEIRFKIGADTSALSAGFAKAASVAAAAGRQIEKKLGMQDAFKASAVALGLSVDKIATKVAEFFSGGSAENWKAAADAAERTAAIMDASAEKRLSLEQQIQKLKLEIESDSANTSRAQRMNAPTSVFNPFTGKMGQAQSMAEDEAEAEKRSAEARERIATKEARISALKEAQAEAYGQIVKAEEQLEELGMSSERRHKLLLEDAESLKKDRDQAIKGNKEWMPLQLAYTQKLITAGQLELQITREQTAERQKQAAIMEKLQKAGQSAGSASLDAKTARDESLKFTLDEAASGERGNAEDKARAEKILLYEETARSLSDKGKGASLGMMRTGAFNEKGDPMFQPLTASYYQSQAEKLRQGFDRVKSSDRNPFESVDNRLKEAVDELIELNAKLEKDE